MRFHLTVKGDTDGKLIVEAELGKKRVEGVIEVERKPFYSLTTGPDLTKLLPDSDDQELHDAMLEMERGIMDCLEDLHGNL